MQTTTTKTPSELNPGDKILVMGRYREFRGFVERNGRRCVDVAGTFPHPVEQIYRVR